MKYILMIDTETTSLDHTTGVIRELGMVIVKAYRERGRTMMEEVAKLCCLYPVQREDWDSKTLEFASKADSNSGAGRLPSLLLEWERLSRDTIVKQRLESAKAANNFINHYEATLEGGLDAVINHPQFDIPFMRDAGTDLVKMVKYNRIWDLNSLLLGGVSGGDSSTISSRYKKVQSRYRSPHDAIGDCWAQLNKLNSVNFAGLVDLASRNK